MNGHNVTRAGERASEAEAVPFMHEGAALSTATEFSSGDSHSASVLSEDAAREARRSYGHLTSATSQPASIEVDTEVAAEGDTQPLLSQSGHPSHEPSDAGSSGGGTAGISKFEIESLVDEASVIRRVNWHLLPLFFAIGMLCSIDRANLSFAALQVNHDLHFSDAVYGLGSGVFFIGYALFAVPSTFICAAIGAPLFLGGTLIIWGSVAAMFAWMRQSWQFYLLRFILGLAESGAYPGMWYQLALFYSEREMMLAYTVVSTASSLSGVVGAPIAACLLTLDGSVGLHGWQWLFLLEGIPATLLGLTVLHVLAKTPGDAWFLSAEERYWLAHRKEVAAEAEESKSADMEGGGPERGQSAWDSLLTMLRESRIWWLAAIWSIISVGMDGLIFWIPLLIKSIMYGEDVPGEETSRTELNGHAVHSAFLAGVPFTSAAIGMLVVAQLSKRAGERHWHVATPLALGTVAVVVMALVGGSSKWLAFAMLSVAAVGIWGPHGPLLTWPAAILEGTAAASGFALIKMMGAFAAFLGNAAMGELHEETGSFELPMLLLAGLMALGAVLALSFDKSGRKGRIDVRPLITRLQNRMGMKRSRSDPASMYPHRTFSGSLSTIREHIARPHGAQTLGDALPHFEMPDMYPNFHARTDLAAAERRAIEHSLAW